MSLMVPADLQQRVNALLETGRYASEEEILRCCRCSRSRTPT